MKIDQKEKIGDKHLTIYLDMVYLLNVLVDYLLLMLTARILKLTYKKWRLFFAASIGGMIVLFLFTPFASFVYHPLFKIGLSFLMIYIAFSFVSIGRFIHHVLTFYFMTFIVGGGMFALHFLFQTEVHVIEGMFYTKTSGMGDPISWLFVCITLPLLYIFSKKRLDELTFYLGKKEQMVDVLIGMKEKTIECQGLVDTGNQLYDPVTKKPVLILSKKAVEQLFSVEDVLMIRKCLWEEFLFKSEHFFRLIPYKVVGKEEQLLPIVKPTLLLINGQKVEGYVGLTHIELSEAEEFLCIVHPKMMRKAG